MFFLENCDGKGIIYTLTVSCLPFAGRIAVDPKQEKIHRTVGTRTKQMLKQHHLKWRIPLSLCKLRTILIWPCVLCTV